jgi:hypothetical protein
MLRRISSKLKVTIFWVCAPCSLVEVYRRFGGSCCLLHQGDQLTVILCFIRPRVRVLHNSVYHAVVAHKLNEKIRLWVRH